MASNNDWFPLPQKKNGSNKKTKDNQSKLLRQLNEMFGSTFEQDIIISVAQNCNWKLEPSIDTLITLSSNVQTPMEPSNTYSEETQIPEQCNPWILPGFSNNYNQTNSSQMNEGNFLNMNPNELLQQQRELQKFENTRCTDGNVNYGASCSESNQKVGTASLCGLKVQYRLKGTENSDDDADVVIEEESSDYRIETPEPERVNVCQFLSTSTQCPPRTTFPKVNYINTPSSPRTSQRLPPVVLSTVSSRLEDDINKGYKILILMRGAPGSGKSYLARNIVSRTVKDNYSGHIFSTDDYFLKINRGVYKYDSSRIQEAHNFNHMRVLNAMRQGVSPIIVDNTNTKAWEMHSYAIIAVENGYIVETLEPDTPWFWNVHELEMRNIHNVPKNKIRIMLERYEPKLTGERLLKMFSLNYAPDNRPPQIRQTPPFFPKPTPIIVNNMPVVSYQFDEPMFEKPDRLIDNEALNTIAKEYAKLEPGTGETNSSNAIKVFNESWTEGSSYKEDSFLLEMMKLGAIGSERRVTQVVNQSEPSETNKLIKEEPKVEDDLVMHGSIGIEQVRDDVEVSDYNEDKNEIKPETIEVDPMSNCWDFTLFLDGKEIHSKCEEPVNIQFNKLIDESSSKNLPEDTEVSTILASKINQDNETSTEAAIISVTDLTLEDACIRPTSDILDEISTPSDKTRSSSDSSSLERVSDVDISQFEMCNTEIIDDVTPPSDEPVSEELQSEKQSSTGLGLLFTFIKNSFIGNDKEKTNKQAEHDNTDTPEVYASCTDELDLRFYRKFTDLPVEDTSSITNVPDYDSLINFEPDLDNNVFYEASEFPQKESAMNVVEELLEASSEVEQTSQVDFSERKTATKSEELEKNFSERMENLHIRVKSEEDENKVSKEPIHLAFGGKNIFPEKMQAQTNSSSKSSKTSSISSSAGNSVTNGDSGEDHCNGNVNDNVNNVYLINWRESPFPLDATPLITTTEPRDVESKPETCDRATHTDPYDFNVLYIGGTDEYKIIEAVSRNINEASRLLSNDVEEPPMRKLMLHKGTMTNTTILFRGPVFDVDNSINNEDHSEELIERFSHLPRACVIDVYENLCIRDYNWTLDYLNNMQLDDVIMYESLGFSESTKEKAPEVAAVPETVQQPSSSESSSAEVCEPPRQPDQQQQQVHFRSKRERYRASGDLLALKEQLEGKFVLSEDSYPAHTLRVKRWKRGEFDEPKVEPVPGDLMSFDEQPYAQPYEQSYIQPYEQHYAQPYEQQYEQQYEQPYVQAYEQPYEHPPPLMSLQIEPPNMLEPRKLSRLDHPAMEEEEEEQPTEDEDSMEEEVLEEEMMELRLGYDFIRVLEAEFGSANFQAPEGLFPVIQIRRSMAQELHALWIESVQQQLWVMQEQLDCMIAKDAEYARSLEVEESKPEFQVPESDVPNLKEIMDMEMALATYSNDRVKQKFMKKTHNDLASHVTQQTLHEMFPSYDPAMLYEIYEAHSRNFDETVKVIEENGASRSTITMADVLKKRKNLIDELQKESRYQTSRHNQLESVEDRDEASGGDYRDYEGLDTYEEAVETARYSRAEARRQLTLRNENYQKAAEACRRKKPEVAAYYSDVAKLHIRNMEAANVMAASAFLAAQTHILEADDTLDLHFLHVPEAIEALDLFLDHQLKKLSKGCRKYIFIITGRGARSINGQSKIKPVVEKKLNSRKIRFSEANPGMLKALLRKK